MFEEFIIGNKSSKYNTLITSKMRINSTVVHTLKEFSKTRSFYHLSTILTT